MNTAALRVDAAVAAEIASAYLDAPSGRAPIVEAAYARLAMETDRLFAAITWPSRPDAVRVRFSTCARPYDTADELIASVRGDRLLEITAAKTDHDRKHPCLTVPRAVRSTGSALCKTSSGMAASVLGSIATASMRPGGSRSASTPASRDELWQPNCTPSTALAAQSVSRSITRPCSSTRSCCSSRGGRAFSEHAGPTDRSRGCDWGFHGRDRAVERLQHRGFTVVAPPNPLRGPASDAPYPASFLQTIPGPNVLVAHSYGGFVATNAATGNANGRALVYIDAFTPDARRSLGWLLPRRRYAFNAPPSPGEVVDLYLRSESNGPYPTCSEWLANGVNPSQTTPLAAVQRPAALDQATQHVTAETFHARRSVGDGLPPWTY